MQEKREAERGRPLNHFDHSVKSPYYSLCETDDESKTDWQVLREAIVLHMKEYGQQVSLYSTMSHMYSVVSKVMDPALIISVSSRRGMDSLALLWNSPESWDCLVGGKCAVSSCAVTTCSGSVGESCD